jgi:hypothetical protein
MKLCYMKLYYMKSEKFFLLQIFAVSQRTHGAAKARLKLRLRHSALALTRNTSWDLSGALDDMIGAANVPRFFASCGWIGVLGLFLKPDSVHSAASKAPPGAARGKSPEADFSRKLWSPFPSPAGLYTSIGIHENLIYQDSKRLVPREEAEMLSNAGEVIIKLFLVICSA